MKAFVLLLSIFSTIDAPAQWYSKNLQNFPCKSEGLSMFFADSNLNIGFKNEAGNIVIPAEYNWASPFSNGLAFALKGGTEVCPGYDGDFPHCEGAHFDNAKLLLINTKNELLVNNIKLAQGETLLLSTYTEDPTKLKGNNYRSFTTNNKSIGFVDLHKEFTAWYNSTFRLIIEKQDLESFKKLLFHFIDTTDINQGNYSVTDRMMLASKDYFNTGKKMPPPSLFADSERGNLSYHTSEKYQGMIASKELNRAFREYVNDCNQFDYGRYPLISFYKVIKIPRVTPLLPGKTYSEETKKYEYEPLTLKFIRTAEGYKLYGISRL